MQLNLKGKSAIVTGASKGIGAAIAMALAAEGVNVVVNYANSKGEAEKVVERIIANGGKALAVQGNVGVAVEVNRLFKVASATFGTISILVNNAGIFKYGPMESIREEQFLREYGTNVLGPLLTIQEAVKYFPESGGSIINIGSAASQNPSSSYTLYASTKGAVDVMSKSLARELGPRKIRVNVVAPGATETEGSYAAGIMGTEKEKVLIERTPLGRLGQPEDVANVVTFLASDLAAWITGERIQASGGL